ncbi:uncharacterized protein C8Q71DRAFT_863523 [Rhodofomes roseus]|uniref:Queuosine 5'-phosphate N-glycosylase/hydrolase n=1 Tax=Rhodofomes roseus TaxID=34475 RepID=A0ABQ8JZ42_9APHY|nr:uncharacterized protein C8Q71DRAFT_863523 [Rhodofomes roseus]KAH9829078.1 hypothetical protein C8Q71DRAFT_863523 [Rhodofomes roseus]
MALNQNQKPPSGAYIHTVRESARSARERANITITDEGIQRLLLSPAFTLTFPRLRTAHGYALPLAFPSPAAELNVLAILSLLNFGSGYRVPLHAATGRGAFDTIRAFIFGMYISSDAGENYLTARGMSNISTQTVAELLGVAGKIHVEKAHESIPGLMVGELGGEVWELVRLVTRVMNETGEVLVEGGYPDLGAFVLEALREGKKAKDEETSCDVVLERLVRGIPAFRDIAIVEGNPIYCFKKALLTIHSIARRFGISNSGSSIPVPPGTERLPIFVDNVIPSLLVHLGVLDLSTSTPSLGLAKIFPDAGTPEKLSSLLAEAANTSDPKTARDRTKEPPEEGPVLTVEQAYVLRAAAIDACERIVKVARTLDTNGREDLVWMKEITPPEVDAWLWAVAKDRPDYRKLTRFVLRDTPFF